MDDSVKKRVLVLGSTGSIGKQALQVIDFHNDRLEIAGLAAHSSAELLSQQAQQFGLSEHACCLTARDGMDALLQLIDATQPDIVLNALVGSAGLRVTMHTLEAGLTLALANKESLIVGGELVTSCAKSGQMLPVDSEHSAIFQCLQAGNASALRTIWLTASGGPFRGKTRNDLREVKAVDALAHPTWNMGPKITIDSATLMNKGLEVIEAHHLFGTDYDDIKVLVQPKSLIHSMVEFVDGSTVGHLGIADMRVPIQYALSYPDRWPSVEDLSIDYRQATALEVGEPDLDTFGCLRLAYQAGRSGGSAPCILNAANEVAVAAFLKGQIGFLDIERLVEGALSHFAGEIAPLESIEQVEDLDTRVRDYTAQYCNAV
ncbi:MAG: 1-deoxy-D-xylulose-5-phosphate reductoisomerase [Coriobacteriia bacterium]|nr:1-deoxy-D-xylulose-5-phosphate reductoisomerase [Coriobacteriia bacterium]MCL2746715.1 1-deoxy-D-xylulose-5-phosphate reductoisomerase [Coriobacteriia bacterium]MCL2870116.1 1-deoxy-D-xylulose-5-phosphate reductoisomerase [Coriobacteriia bacterium]